MPNYEFICDTCQDSMVLTIPEDDSEKPTCPHGSSHEIEQRWSAFSAVTSKKST
jgi:putative FmdB family regulatory protein